MPTIARSEEVEMARARPSGSSGSAGDGGKKKKPPTEVVRAPEDLAEMLEVIAQHKINGWGSVPEILRDPDCPLHAWLLPLYQRALAEKAKRVQRMQSEG